MANQCQDHRQICVSSVRQGGAEQGWDVVRPKGDHREIPKAQRPLSSHVVGSVLGPVSRGHVWVSPSAGTCPARDPRGTARRFRSELCFGLGFRHVFMAGNFRS